MRNNRLFVLALAVWGLALFVTHTHAAAPATAPAATTSAPASEIRFLRFVGDSKTGGSLQTADVTYENEDGAKVRLVSAIHIGDTSYFQALNKSFEGCDAVLYEMVKPRDHAAPRPGDAQSDIARFQRFLKDTLDLDYQLDVIDYTPKNFVHADMDADEFAQRQAARGESIPGLMLASLMRQLTNPAVATETYEDEATDMLELMSRPDGTRQFKLLLARRMGDIEKDVMGLGAMEGTVILTERNKAAVKVLREQLKAGKNNIAIFYGAAHMPDLAERLDLLGFVSKKTEWHKAWDVTIRKDQPSAFQRLMEMTARATTQPAD